MYGYVNEDEKSDVRVHSEAVHVPVRGERMRILVKRDVVYVHVYVYANGNVKRDVRVHGGKDEP